MNRTEKQYETSFNKETQYLKTTKPYCHFDVQFQYKPMYLEKSNMRYLSIVLQN